MARRSCCSAQHAPECLVGALAGAALDHLAPQAPEERLAGAVSPDIDPRAHTRQQPLWTGQLESRGHLLHGLEALELDIHSLAPGGALEIFSLACERGQCLLERGEASAVDPPAGANGQRPAQERCSIGT